MIQIYHAKKEFVHVVHLVDSDDGWALLKKNYEHVATVDTADLEFAWRWTNNVDSSWSQEPHPSVRVLAPLPILNGETYGHRSSMTGDVFVKDDRPYLVASAGFKELES